MKFSGGYDQDPTFRDIRFAFLEAVENFHKERKFTQDFFLIADELEISVKSLDLKGQTHEGMSFILPDSQKIILIRDDLPPKREIFTRWHELSHHLFKILMDGEFKALLDDLVNYHPDWASSCEEELCYESAALLLMPTHVVDNVIDELGFSPISVFSLSDVTEASYSAAMRRIVERKGFDSHSLLIRPDGYVISSFHFGERRGKYRIGSNFKIGQSHPLLTRSFEPLEVEKFLTPIPFKHSPVTWESKCMAASDSKGWRIAAFFVDDYGLNHRFGHRGGSSPGEEVAKTWGHTGL